MAIIRGIFDSPIEGVSVVPSSARATENAAKQRAVQTMREQIMQSPFWMGEAYGVRIDSWQNPNDLMPAPADVDWGPNFLEKTCEDMRRNVPEWAALLDGATDLVEHLEMSFLPGVAGDAESEFATEACRLAWEAYDERKVFTQIMGSVHELGFRGAENVYDVMTRGKMVDLIYPAEQIPRPIEYFGFNYAGRAVFKADARRRGDRELPVVPEFKVCFARAGDLHTRYGRGLAEDGYPTVRIIDMNNKEMAKQAERWGYLPMAIKTPWNRTDPRFIALHAEVSRHWRNFLIMPNAVEADEPVFEVLGTEGNAAASNTIRAILEINRDLVTALSHLVQGSQNTSGTSQVGSLARDQNASSDRMFKAPSRAAVKEAMVNRGFIAPIIVLNFPTLDRAKWPRCSIDSSFGEDLSLKSDIIEQGVALGAEIEVVTWSEIFSVPVKNAEGAILSPRANPIAAPIDPEQQAIQAFSEQQIEIITRDGQRAFVPPDWQFATERGAVRAGALQRNDVIVGAPRGLRLVR